nr:ABC transporter substrate-binding protein [uncultured Devosia sp.]
MFNTCKAGKPARSFSRSAWLGGLSLALAMGCAMPALAQDGPTLTVGISTPVNQLIPHSVFQGTMPWIHTMYDALVFWDGGPTPQLAEGWEMSEDSRTLTVKLRPGITFHDGKPLTAQIVVDNLTWATDPANNVTGNAFLKTGTFTATDDLTVTLEFPIPAPQILTVLAVLPIMDLTSDIVSSPNGTGPFKLAEFIPGTSMSYIRNDDYWDKERMPTVARIDFPMYPDNASLMAALSSGQVQILAFPDFRQITVLEGQGMQLVSQDPPGNFMLRVNAAEGSPVSDPLVRKALSYAINRPVFSQLMTGGKSTPTCSHFPPASPAYTPEIDQACEYNLDKAKELLTEAGYGDGLTIEYLAGSVRQPELTGYVPILQEDLAKIGVTLSIEDLSSQALGDRVQADDYQVAGDWYPWGIFDPAVFFIGPSFAPNNLSNFTDPAYLDMLTAAQSEVDQEKRMGMYQDINRYLSEQDFIIPIGTRPYNYAVRPEVTGFGLDPFGMAFYNDVRMP